MKRTVLRVAAATAACGLLTMGGISFSTPAHAVDGNIAYGLEYGNVDRASFSEHANAVGFRINSYGSSPCSSATSDRDLSVAGVRPDWNDSVTWVSDWNSCDTALYYNANFGIPFSNDFGVHTVNYGGGRNLGWGQNDAMTSFYLS